MKKRVVEEMDLTFTFSELLSDILAALGVVLNGIPQGLLALSYGFASIPTGIGFVIGAVACMALGSVAPISFQAETIVLAGTMGKNLRERLSMILYAGLLMVALGLTGTLTYIVNLAGETVINAMMAGVGILLAKIALDGLKKNRLVTAVSIASAVVVYFLFGRDLVLTIVASVVISSIVAKIAKQDIGGGIIDEVKKIKLVKPTFNLNVLRGALALACLTIGANIAFGSITASMTGGQYTANIDHLTVYSGLADAVSGLFGGGPVEAIISATAAAPQPVLAGVIMMLIMAAILFLRLLPKIGKYVPSESIYGFLFILGAVVTVPTNAGLAFAGQIPGNAIVAGVTLVVTAGTDPFFGLVSGTLLRYLFESGII